MRQPSTARGAEEDTSRLSGCDELRGYQLRLGQRGTSKGTRGDGGSITIDRLIEVLKREMEGGSPRGVRARACLS